MEGTTSAPTFPQGRVRKRAAAACESCRYRKVRCDARDGHPCSNCIFDGVHCVLPNKRRRKACSKPTNPRPAGTPLSAQFPTSTECGANERPPQPTGTLVTTPPQCPVVDRSSTNPDYLSVFKDPRDWPSLEFAWTPSRSGISLGCPAQPSPLSTSTEPSVLSIDMPHFIKAPPATMEPEDLEYLRVKGALTVPEPELRDACLRCYFLNVQPLFPVVDTFKTLSILDGTDPDNDKLSLLVFQGLLFVGSTWVSPRLVRKLGFLSRKAFRKSIYRKIRLLYDADYEHDRMCLIQTFVLCTFWWEGPDENKDGWHWIGLALSLSRTVGLHQSQQDGALHAAERRQRKRLWWALVARDVIGSFGLSRSPRITDTDYNVPMLQTDDFDFQTLPVSQTNALPQTVEQQHSWAKVCITFIRLVHIFGRVLKAAYPESGSGKTAVLYSDRQLEGLNELSLPTRQLNRDQLKIHEEELKQWQQQVPDWIWHNPALPPYPQLLERAELAHRGLLSVLYYTALLTLHRPWSSSSGSLSNHTEASETIAQNRSQLMVRYTARSITRIMMDFFETDLVDSLSATCISCLIPASTSHIFDMNSTNQTVRLKACQQLEQCKAILQAFADQQYAGPWTLNVINHIVSRAAQRRMGGRVRQASGENVNFHLPNPADYSAKTLARHRGSVADPQHCEESSFAGSIESQNNVPGISGLSGASCPASDMRGPTSVSTSRILGDFVNTSLPMLTPDWTISDDFFTHDSMWHDVLRTSEPTAALGSADGILPP